MFGNFRGGRQARNFTTNVPKNSRSQIIFRSDIFQSLTLGAPERCCFQTLPATKLTLVLPRRTLSLFLSFSEISGTAEGEELVGL